MSGKSTLTWLVLSVCCCLTGCGSITTVISQPPNASIHMKITKRGKFVKEQKGTGALSYMTFSKRALHVTAHDRGCERSITIENHFSPLNATLQATLFGGLFATHTFLLMPFLIFEKPHILWFAAAGSWALGSAVSLLWVLHTSHVFHKRIYKLDLRPCLRALKREELEAARPPTAPPSSDLKQQIHKHSPK